MDERLVQFDEKMQKTMNNLSEEFGLLWNTDCNSAGGKRQCSGTENDSDPAMGSFYGKRNRESDLNVRSWNQSDK